MFLNVFFHHIVKKYCKFWPPIIQTARHSSSNVPMVVAARRNKLIKNNSVWRNHQF